MHFGGHCDQGWVKGQNVMGLKVFLQVEDVINSTGVHSRALPSDTSSLNTSSNCSNLTYYTWISQLG